MYPPRAPKWLVLRNLYRLARRPIPVFTEYLKRYGSNFILSVGASRVTHFTTDAEVAQHVLQRNHRNYAKSEIQSVEMSKYLGHGLLTNNGDDWLRQRRLIQPGFHRKRIDALAKNMQAVIESECARAAGQASFDLFRFTRMAAYNIISRAIFTDGFTSEETERLHYILDTLQEYIIMPIRLPFLRAPLRWLGRERKHLALAAEARALVLKQIQARKATTGNSPDDLLQMLLDSRYEDTGDPMSEERLVDEILILFAAGYETSANALAWTIWLLLGHGEVMERVQAELKDAGPATADSVGQLTYLTQVIEESLRMYPPAWITDRVALGPDEAGGYTVDKNVVIGVFIYGIHHSEAYYDSPEEFRPERMEAAAKKDRPAFSFLPFGGGPRQCIGNHFAMLEMQLLLAHLFAHYRVKCVTPLPRLQPRPFVTLHQDQNVEISLM